MKKISPYTVKWAILTPVAGTANKVDNTLINKISLYWRNRKETDILVHAPNQITLNKKIESFRGRLTKKYSVLFITDKQFGLKKENEAFNQIATKRQLLDKFIIC